MARHHVAVDPKLAAQQALVDEWAAEYGPLDEESLRPFLEMARRAQELNRPPARVRGRFA